MTMIIRQPQVLVPDSELDPNLIRKIERYARVCYKSEAKMGPEENLTFLKSILKRGHESVIEHEKITAMFIVDRGVSHEIVRHRVASYSQESTRYCNYAQDKFGSEISVIEPYYFVGTEGYEHWELACLTAERHYMTLLAKGYTPQEARSILPNSLKTELVVTYNLREWRHFFTLRCSAAAHPQMRQVAIPLLLLFKERLPILFADVEYDQSFPAEHYAEVRLTDDLFSLV